MYRYILTILAIALSLTYSHARLGVVVAHYGSSNDATRTLTINRITQEIRDAAGPDIPVAEAYISPAVRKAMTKRGLEALSPVDAMLSLRSAGFDSLIVQPTLIIDGAEMAGLTHDVESLRPFFSQIDLGRPLCFTPDDFEKVVDILAADDIADAEAVIFVGHGNSLPSTATYAQLDYMLADRGLIGRHVSTIEGYPDAESTARQLARESPGIRCVRLVPLLLVCGNHTLNDIAGHYANTLRAAGYEPQILMRGLAELPQIRALYVARVMAMLGQLPR